MCPKTARCSAAALLYSCVGTLHRLTSKNVLHKVCSRRCSCVLVAACLAACMQSCGPACGQTMKATAGMQVVLPQLATSYCGSRAHKPLTAAACGHNLVLTSAVMQCRCDLSSN